MQKPALGGFLICSHLAFLHALLAITAQQRLLQMDL